MDPFRTRLSRIYRTVLNGQESLVSEILVSTQVSTAEGWGDPRCGGCDTRSHGLGEPLCTVARLLLLVRCVWFVGFLPLVCTSWLAFC